jgi:hypothetical protein
LKNIVPFFAGSHPIGLPPLPAISKRQSEHSFNLITALSYNNWLKKLKLIKNLD